MLANLKMALAVRGMLQIELAQKLEVSPDLVSRIVRGWTEPSQELRSRIAEVVQADEGWLFLSDIRIPAPQVRRLPTRRTSW